MSRPRRLKKVLVANRGEIAIRIFRACQEMGIKTAAIFSDADQHAIHARYADEAHRIGPAAPTESYLALERIVKPRAMVEGSAFASGRMTARASSIRLRTRLRSSSARGVGTISRPARTRISSPSAWRMRPSVRLALTFDTLPTLSWRMRKSVEAIRPISVSSTAKETRSRASRA